MPAFEFATANRIIFGAGKLNGLGDQLKGRAKRLLLVTGPILLKGWRETPVNGIGFLIGFYVTLISSLAALILIFGTAAKLGPKFNRMLLGISAIALTCFGLYQLWLGIFYG